MTQYIKKIDHTEKYDKFQCLSLSDTSLSLIGRAMTLHRSRPIERDQNKNLAKAGGHRGEVRRSFLKGLMKNEWAKSGFLLSPIAGALTLGQRRAVAGALGAQVGHHRSACAPQGPSAPRSPCNTRYTDVQNVQTNTYLCAFRVFAYADSI